MIPTANEPLVVLFTKTNTPSQRGQDAGRPKTFTPLPPHVPTATPQSTLHERHGDGFRAELDGLVR
jgi:hypothetical protein